MKLFTPTLAALALFVAAAYGLDLINQNEVSLQTEASQVGQVSPYSQGSQNQEDQEEQNDAKQQDNSALDDSSCTLTGTYVAGTNVTHCSSILIDSLSVPAGVMLDLTNVTAGTNIKFQGTTTFGPKKWEGPLIKLKGKDLTVTGPGTLEGQGQWYWPQGQNITRPVFFRLSQVVNSTLSGFTIKNMPFRTFSILSSNYTTISGLTIDSRAGNGSAKNTDGFDLSRNNHVTITRNRVYNQDDCLAMQSSSNTIFSENYCSGGHGISIGSLGAKEENINSTVSGLLVKDNTIVNNDNGIRIKTIIGMKGLVTNVTYTNNKLVNVKHAIVMRSDYNKTKGGYSRIPSSLVKITNIKVDGLFGTATNLYNIFTNPDVVSDWTFTNIAVNTTNIGNCTGEPSNVQC
ncbi:polygalacturonase [Phytophthora sojae]|uniref:endo-polygalacturonase n=1 Tax=Phytophthora sojae (strain P6497) TaxID=1094619 RepID=G4ZL41_PHYSP|nr:polygalacturonase [Phytophthora sojae]EGZ15263.1 polygalacturonase [Phytophthora sojae]|eukprot:XP_009529012.1 polygalacturonase [Phytophthora sojae]